ncbi:MAG: TolC family protein [Opitutales bacterium]|nr:TolC family protein [Opitutales bacterium]
MKNFLMKKNLWLALAAGTMLAGTACSTVDEAREAQKPENRLRGERTVSFAEYDFPAGTVLSLADLEKIALDANPKIFQARQAVISAQLAVKDIRADYLPTIDASAAYSRGTHNSTERGQSFHSSGGNEIGLSLDLLLWDFGKTDAKLEQAVARLLSAEKDLLSAENLVRYNVRKAYFELRRNIELDVVAEQSVSQYKEHLAQMRAYRDAGKGTKYDCTKAEVDYNNAVLQSISIANNVKTARADLNLALGFAESPDYELGGNAMGSFDPDVDALMNIAREREPGLASLVALEKAASAHIDKTVADLFPSVGLNFSATLEGEDLDMPKIWNLLGVGKISQNVFNGGRNLRAIEDAVAKLRVARSKVAAYEQQLYASLTTAVLTLTRARKQYEVALLSESAAKENFDIVTAQFNVGKASALDRTDAQVSLTEARAATVSSEYDFREAVSAIAYLIATDPVEEQVGD